MLCLCAAFGFSGPLFDSFHHLSSVVFQIVFCLFLFMVLSFSFIFLQGYFVIFNFQNYCMCFCCCCCCVFFVGGGMVIGFRINLLIFLMARWENWQQA